MRKIKVDFIDLPKARDGDHLNNAEMSFVLERLRNYYQIEITNKNPDIVFCDFYGNEYIKYDCIRVSYFTEEYAPNFNIYDYAITLFQDYSYKDRVLCLPVPIHTEAHRNVLKLALNRQEFSEEDFKRKTGFCSFVQSKGTGADSARVDFFHKLSEYKKVDSGGRLLNNIGGPVKDKLAFEMEHKFSISFINGRNYTMQDRPLDAFAANTIPIYWGNPDIGKLYNSKAFVNCHGFNNFDEVIEHIKKVDNDDQLYLNMMNEPIFLEGKTLKSEIERFDNFLINIVENGTIQRSGVYWNRVFEKEIYYGRKKFTRLNRLANKTRPVTRVLFNTKAGQFVKKKILDQATKKGLKDAYRNIK